MSSYPTIQLGFAPSSSLAFVPLSLAHWLHREAAACRTSPAARTRHKCVDPHITVTDTVRGRQVPCAFLAVQVTPILIQCRRRHEQAHSV